ncbi:hypothetical protein GALL_385660 [mine drainage metagenome]|uniref:Uncharacterized protein n=1 Tax=mine drainage metagenome TaxID=410659 RepID=A0A1J5Q7T4_9ZZZZ
MATLTSASDVPASASAARVACTTPREVAVARPSDPPTASGLPVATPGIVKPRLTEYVSMTQAIVCSLVPMSGARMSRSGPIIGMISLVYRRVTRSSSRFENSRGSIAIPPLAPP